MCWCLVCWGFFLFLFAFFLLVVFLIIVCLLSYSSCIVAARPVGDTEARKSWVSNWSREEAGCWVNTKQKGRKWKCLCYKIVVVENKSVKAHQPCTVKILTSSSNTVSGILETILENQKTASRNILLNKVQYKNNSLVHFLFHVRGSLTQK